MSVALWWLILAILLAACSSGADRHELLVFGASSLTDVLGEAEDSFEKANPDVDVQLNLAGSSALREQILNGAPADVFIPASPIIMQELVEAGEIAGDVSVVAGNRIVIAVPPGNPAGITGIESFERSELLLGVCSPSVPCGELAYRGFAESGVEPSIDTQEPDVRSLLTKIAEGELDGGIVYATDVVAAAGAVQTVDLPESAVLGTNYDAAVTAGAGEPKLAAAFINSLSSEQGQKLFRTRGFATP
ncbi:MAG: molybdate ABC transporter substrate-binding protein [Acidimicrobiia bacterium]|nr:molybdate ABC transporter substrate-binding protein [Acidimicrobiia bacterium]